MSTADPEAVASAVPQLRALLEFWFSDANLRRDGFMKNKVTGAGPEGWVCGWEAGNAIIPKQT